MFRASRAARRASAQARRFLSATATSAPPIILEGQIQRVLYKGNNAYTVCTVKAPEQEDLITCVGSMPRVFEGEDVKLRGSFSSHPKHGAQFTVDAFHLSDQKPPVDLAGICKILETVKGVGPVLSRRIVDLHGDKTFDVLETDPESLVQIKGCDARVVSEMRRLVDPGRERELMHFLVTNGMANAIALAYRCLQELGPGAIKVLKSDPFTIAQFRGVGFQHADALARGRGIERESAARVRAGLEHVLVEQSRFGGHTCLPRDKVLAMTAKLLGGISPDHVVDELQKLKSQSPPLIVEEEAAAAPPGASAEGGAGAAAAPASRRIWWHTMHRLETDIARKLVFLQGQAPALQLPRESDVGVEVARAGASIGVDFSREQQEAIAGSFSSPVSIVTGGPGTGKSTIVRGVVHLAERCCPQARVALVAPTGIAADRLSRAFAGPGGSGRKGTTIHRLLNYDHGSRGFRHDAEDPVPHDLVVVDEVSMVDSELLRALLRALAPGTRLVLIGDSDQLPSIGAGAVLADLIASRVFQVSELRAVVRQGEGSGIVRNAHLVNSGRVPELAGPASLGAPDGPDCVFVPCEDQHKIPAAVLDALRSPGVAGRFERDMDVQMMSPRRARCPGVDAASLNAVGQAHFNGGSPKVKGHPTLRLGDKVMQVENDYDREVFNGELGRVSRHVESRGAPDNDALEVVFGGREVKYGRLEWDKVALAHCVSVHKSQGCEFDCVIMPLHPAQGKMVLSRRLLYTAMTRAKQKLVFVGSEEALRAAVGNTRREVRFTGLKERLREEAGGPRETR